MDNALVLPQNANGNLLAVPLNADAGISGGRPGAGTVANTADRPYAGAAFDVGNRGGVTEMLGVTIRPGVINVAAKEASMQRNATEPSGSKWKWYHWAIAIVLLAAVAYGGFLIYKKYK